MALSVLTWLWMSLFFRPQRPAVDQTRSPQPSQNPPAASPKRLTLVDLLVLSTETITGGISDHTTTDTTNMRAFQPSMLLTMNRFWQHITYHGTSAFISTVTSDHLRT